MWRVNYIFCAEALDWTHSEVSRMDNYRSVEMRRRFSSNLYTRKRVWKKLQVTWRFGE